MSSNQAVTIVLLAGGHATRLPGKLSRLVGDEPLLTRVYRQLTQTGRPCIVSVREHLPLAVSRHLHAPVVVDTYDDAGPLGGLASAAALVQTPLLFAAAGDLANIDATVIDALEYRYRRAREGGQAPDAVVPRHPSGDVEPLAALYDTQRLLASARRMLSLGQKKVTATLEGLRVIYHDINSSDSTLYHNVNTLDDLAGITQR